MLNTFDFVWNNSIGRLAKREQKRKQERLKRREQTANAVSTSLAAFPVRGLPELDKDVRKLELLVTQVTDFLYDNRLTRDTGKLEGFGDEVLYKPTYWSPTGDKEQHQRRNTVR